MKKDNSIIIGSGVIGSYLANFYCQKTKDYSTSEKKKSYTIIIN